MEEIVHRDGQLIPSDSEKDPFILRRQNARTGEYLNVEEQVKMSEDSTLIELVDATVIFTFTCPIEDLEGMSSRERNSFLVQCLRELIEDKADEVLFSNRRFEQR